MRLIDADELIESLHDNSKHKPVMAPFKLCTADIVDLKFLLNSEPTINAVPVVRCRECKHYDTADFDGNILCGCTLHSAMLDITPDSFCSYGERKEGADNG